MEIKVKESYKKSNKNILSVQNKTLTFRFPPIKCQMTKYNFTVNFQVKKQFNHFTSSTIKSKMKCDNI